MWEVLRKMERVDCLETQDDTHIGSRAKLRETILETVSFKSIGQG